MRGSGLPVVSGASAVKTFRKDGWIVIRQEGSHVMLIKPGELAILSIPQHKELGPGLLRKLIKKAGLTVDQFKKLQ